MGGVSEAAEQQGSVLVVDDEPQVLRAIEDTLEESFRVYAEDSPEAAIEMLTDIPDLCVIISDQRMPGLTGDEFLARAREISSATRLMLTGYADMEAVIRAVNIGKIFGYVSKPWYPDHLKLAVIKAAEHYRLLKDLATERELLHQLMDNSPDAIFFKDLERRYTRVNRAHAAYMGVDGTDRFHGKTYQELFHQGDAEPRDAEDRELFRTGVPVRDAVYSRRLPTGALRWFSTTKAPIRDAQGRVTGLVGISRDVTERTLQEHKIRRLTRIHEVLSGINGAIVRIQDRQELFSEACRIAVKGGRFRFVWIGLVDREAMRVTPAAFAGEERGFLKLIEPRLSLRDQEPDARSPAWHVVTQKRPFIVNDIQEDARILPKSAHRERNLRALAVLPIIVADEPVAILGLHAEEAGFFDEEEMKLLLELAADIGFALGHIEKSERLDYLAFYDSLTGLANRNLFHERLGQYVAAAARNNEKLAVLVVDVERFKGINDLLGWHGGDQVLKQLAERKVQVTGEPDRHARISMDHFAVLVPNIEGEEGLARRMEKRLQEIYGPPFQVNGHELRISVKVGAAMFPGDGSDAETLMRNAEAALKRSKTIGERYVFYTQAMSERIAEKLSLENKLRLALERAEFVLHYQPKVNLTDRRIVGVEALIRWQSPDLGQVPPLEFIPLLEETGLILDVGAWALERAARDFREWKAKGLSAPRIAVNVSPLQLRSRDFVDVVRGVLGVDDTAASIDLEITESVIMEDIGANIGKLKAIRDLGIKIAIDDFGTGYSSLAYLAKLPIHSLKIDRSFIDTMSNDPDSLGIVSTVISLSHAFSYEVCAEGVETEDQARLLRLLKCDQAQGYFFGKPVPAIQIDKMLKTIP